MKRTLFFILISAAIATPAGAKLRVASTVPDLAAIAHEVAGTRAEVYSLTLPTQDPHFVDARPHLALKLNRAHLLLTVGLQLEVGWLPVLLTGARNARIQPGTDGYLDCSSVVALKEVPRVKIDRSMGDIHPGGNPHYLTDPQNAERVARAIAGRLIKLDADGAASYRKNLQRFIGRLLAARRRWDQQMKPHRGTAVAAYHRSWVYFTEAMGLKIVAHLEPKPGIPPNAAHVLRVIRTLKTHKVPLLLQEEYYPDRTARLVTARSGARLLIMSGGTHLRQGQTYLQRIERMVKQVAGVLNKGQG